MFQVFPHDGFFAEHLSGSSARAHESERVNNVLGWTPAERSDEAPANV